MRKKVIGFALTTSLFALSLPVHAQQPGKMRRIGFLGAAPDYYVETFRQGLRDLGWVEGQTITIEYRNHEGKQEQLPQLAAELVRLKVDVIVATATAPALAAQQATKTIPIVMTSSDPVGTGLVPSLAQPGGNVRGTTSGDLSGKRLELLTEIPRGSFLESKVSRQ